MKGWADWDNQQADYENELRCWGEIARRDRYNQRLLSLHRMAYESMMAGSDNLTTWSAHHAQRQQKMSLIGNLLGPLGKL